MGGVSKPDPVSSCGAGAVGSDTDDKCVMLNTEPSRPHTPKGELSGSWPSSHCLLCQVNIALRTVSLREDGKTTNCCSTSSLLTPGTKPKTREGQLTVFKTAMTSPSALSPLCKHTCIIIRQHVTSTAALTVQLNPRLTRMTPGKEDTACSMAYTVPVGPYSPAVSHHIHMVQFLLFHSTGVSISILIHEHRLYFFPTAHPRSKVPSAGSQGSQEPRRG